MKLSEYLQKSGMTTEQYFQMLGRRSKGVTSLGDYQRQERVNASLSIENLIKESNEVYDSYKTRFFNENEEFINDRFRGDTEEAYTSFSAQKSKFDAESQRILNALNQYSDLYDAETAAGIRDWLKSAKENYTSISETYKSDFDYWSQWNTEDAYKADLEALKVYEEQKVADLPALSAEIEDLKGKKRQWDVYYAENLTEYLKKGYMADTARRKAREAANGKFGGVDIDKTLSDKTQYYNVASRIQKSIEMASVADPESKNYDPDFENKAAIGESKGLATHDAFLGTNGRGTVFGSDVNNAIIAFRNNRDEDGTPYHYLYNRDGNATPLSPEEHAAKYMSDKEYQTYCYYYGASGEDKANEYLGSIEESLNRREAEERFEKLKDNTFLEIAFGFGAGIDQFASGVANFFNGDDYIPVSSMQMTSGMVRDDLYDVGTNILGSSLGQIGFDAATTTGNMLPSVLTSTAVGLINPLAGQVVGATLMGASAAGNAYQEMINLGYDKGQARSYAALVGGSEAGLEFLLGGISKLGGTLTNGAISKMISGIDNAFARGAIKFGGSLLSEGFEEGLQEILNPYFENLVLYTDKDVDWQQVAYSGLLGAISAGMLEGGSIVSGEVSTYQKGKDVIRKGETANLVKLGKSMSADTVAHRLAGKVNEKTGAYTIGRLLHEVGADSLSDTNLAEITKSLTRKGIAPSHAQTIAKWLNKAVEGGYFTKSQVRAIEENELIAQTMRDVIINPNSTVNQRVQGYQDLHKSLTDKAVTGEVNGNTVTDSSAGMNDVAENAPFIPYSNAEAARRRENGEAVAPYKGTVQQVVPENRFKVTDSGVTVDTTTGEVVEISGIDSIQGKKMMLRLSNGETVSAEDVEFASDDEGLLYSAVLDMGVSVDDANVLVNNFKKQGGNVTDYILGIQEAYRYGEYSYPIKKTARGTFISTLTPIQKQAAYNIGKAASEARIKAAQKAVDDKKSTASKNGAHKKGRVRFEKGAKVTTQSQKRVIALAKQLASALGIDIVFYDSTIAGTYGSDSNGYFDPNDNSIHLDLQKGLNDSKTIAFTMAHELTHFIKVWSPAKFKVFADFLMEQYADHNVSTSDLLKLKMAELGTKDLDVAFEEMVCDACERMLLDSNAMEKLAQLKQKDHALWEKIKQHICQVLDKIRGEYNALGYDERLSDEAKALQRMDDVLSKFYELFEDMAVDAAQSFQAATGNDVNSKTEGDLKRQVKKSLAKKKRSVYNEFATAAMIWANKTTRQSGDNTIIYDGRRKKYILIEAMEDGYFEVVAGTYEEMRALYERVHAEEDRGIHADIKTARSEPRRGLWDLQFSQNRGNDDRNAGSPGNQGLQDDTAGGNEHLRSSDQAKPVSPKFQKKQTASEVFTEDKYFKSQIQKWKTLKHGSFVKVGTLGEASPLVMVGMPSGVIRYDVDKLKRNMVDHGDYLNVDLLNNIPSIISNPVAISEYSEENTISVFGNIFVNGSPMMVGVTISKDRGGNIISKVRTFNARRDVGKLITDGAVLYLDEDKKRTQKWFHACGIQVPLGGTKFGLIRSIAQADDSVKSQKKQIDTEKVGDDYQAEKSKFGAYTNEKANGSPASAKNRTEVGHITVGDEKSITQPYNGIKKQAKKKGNGKFDPRTVTEEDVRELLEGVRSGRIYGHTYFPIRTNTPYPLIHWAKSRRGDVIDNNPIAIDAEKAYQAMARSGQDTEGRPHKMSVDDIISVIKGMSDPQYIVYQGGNDRYVEVIGYTSRSGRKAFAVLEIGEDKDSVYMNGYEGGLYNILVTTFPPDSGELKKLLENPKNEVIFDKKKDGSQRSSSSIVPSLLNDSPFFNVSITQPDNGVKNQQEQDIPEKGMSYGSVKSQKKKLTNRTILANALAEMIDTSTKVGENELHVLQQYQENIAKIEELESHLAEIKSEIYRLSFSKGKKDAARLKQLNEEKVKTANRINIYDRKLLSLEATKHMKSLLEREKEMVRKRAEAKGREALASLKQKDADRIQEIIQHNREMRERGVEGRRKTEMRHKIKRVVRELKHLLAHGNKKQNIKEDLKDTVASALAVAELMFTSEVTNEEIVRNGVDAVTAKEGELLKRYADLLEVRDGYLDKIEALSKMASDVRISDQIFDIQEMLDKVDAKIKRYNRDLSDVFARERARLNQATVSSALQSLADAYASIKNSEQLAVAQAYNEHLYNRILVLKDSVQGTAVKDMSIVQLQEVYDTYKMVLTTVKNANKFFKLQATQGVEDTAHTVINEIRSVSKSIDKQTKVAAYIKKVGWQNLKPIYAFRTIGSKTLVDLYNNIREGEDIWYRDAKDAQCFRLEMNKKYGFSAWDFKKQYTFEAENGKLFTLSLEQMLSLYAYSQRGKQAIDHLTNGGFIFDQNVIVTENVRGIPIKYQVNTANRYVLSEDILTDIVASLSEEQKAYVNDMQAYLSDTMGAKGNEVSVALYGVKLFTEEHYFPLKTSAYYMDFKPDEVGERKLINSGFTESTVANSTSPIVLSDFTGVWGKHVNDMSMYHAFVLPLEDFNRVFNFRQRTGENETVKAILQNAYGSGATEYVKTLLQDINGGIKASKDATADKMIALTKKGATYLSLSVAIQQPTAVARACSQIDKKYFVTAAVKALNLKEHNRDWEELKAYAPIAGIKEMGYFDTGVGQSSVDWIVADEYEERREKLKALFTDGDYRDEKLSRLPAFMDEVGWIEIWHAVKNEIAATTDLDRESEEFLKRCGERFTEVITLTQVYDSVFSRSEAMRSRSSLAKMATAFMAESTTTINMLADSVIQGKRVGGKEGRKTIFRTVSAVVASNVLNALARSLVTAGRDDDEDETWLEKYIADVTEGIIDSFNPLMYIPYAKDLVSILQGYDIERMDTTILGNLVKAVKDCFNENKSFSDQLLGVLSAVSAIVGVPVENILRDLKGVSNTYKSFTNGVEFTWYGIAEAVEEGVTGDETSAIERSENAAGRGDTATVKSTVADQVERKVKAGKTEKEARSAVRTSFTATFKKQYLKAVESRDHTEMNRIRKLLYATGLYGTLSELDETLKKWRAE
ncbi:MAG: hypothetical protein IJO75_01690 [Clostridia bacterium]|nr:hypothetical protein [Clostridia bacterium]